VENDLVKMSCSR